MRELIANRAVVSTRPAPLHVGAERDIRRTRWLFVALCGYLLSQAVTIPIVPVGPWALWPTLPDFATAALLLAWLATPRPSGGPSRANRAVLRGLMLLGVGALVSYVLLVLMLPQSPASHLAVGRRGVSVGIFQLYRLAEFFVAFWLTTRIPLTAYRLTVLSRTVVVVFVLVCAGVVLTALSIVPATTLGAHLPQEAEIAGAWATYFHKGAGVGMVGYNHLYVAAQTLLLGSLVIHLAPGRRRFVGNSIVPLAVILVCFLSDSRAGLVGAIIFAVGIWAGRPLYPIIAGGVAMVALMAAPAEWRASQELTIERQSTLSRPYEEEHLSGRVAIWQRRLEFLQGDPTRWIVGSGFGAARDSGSNAHMLYLHLIVETGVLGLAAFTAVAGMILLNLRRAETGVRPIFWASVAVLVSSLTQETLYPDTAIGHFPGLYLCTVAIALRSTWPSDRGTTPRLAGQRAR